MSRLCSLIVAIVLFLGSNLFSEDLVQSLNSGTLNNPQVEKSEYGKMPTGETVYQYKLTNSKGISATLIDYGAALISLKVPDRNGNVEDIVLGYDNLEGYINDNANFGGTIGRYANRIANGAFTINGQTYSVAKNDNGVNHIHGGIKRFNKVLWKGEEFKNGGDSGVKFHYLSKDGEEGYPGNLNVDVTYILGVDRLTINYEATTDKPTVINLTNHSYFNLHDTGISDVLSHLAKINAEKYTPVDNNLIPTGEIQTVIGTPLDFTNWKAIGQDIDKVSPGYDFNYVLNKASGDLLTLAAAAYDKESGRELTLYTTEPGVQFYTGNYLDGIKGKYGVTYKKYHAFCFEPQHYPDSPNHSEFPSTLLNPGQTYKQTSIYIISVN
jgi:aldose 1-epimerase